MNAAGMSSLRERCKSEQRWEEEKEEDKTRGFAVARDKAGRNVSGLIGRRQGDWWW